MLKRTIRLFLKYGVVLQATAVILIALLLTGLGRKNPLLQTMADWLLTLESATVSIILFWRMLGKVRFGSLNFDFVGIIVIVAALFIGLQWVAMAMVAYILLIEIIVGWARAKGQSDLTAGNSVATMATVLRGRKTIVTPLSKLKKNDKLYLAAGETVPVDSIILQGESVLTIKDLSGKVDRVKSSAGDELLSGTINNDNPLTLRVMRDAEHSYMQLLDKLIKNADFTQAPFEHNAERFAMLFGSVLVAIAIVIGIISRENERFLTMIIAITPFSLLSALPLVVLYGLHAAGRRHIIVKSATFLERLAELKTLAFEQRGIATKGEPHVVAVTSFKRSVSEAQILGLGGSLMLHSTHHYSSAITKEAYTRQAPISTVRGLAHDAQAVEGVVVRDQVVLGSYAYLMAHEANFPKAAKNVERPTMFMSINGDIVGSITLADEINPDIEGMLAQAKRFGVEKTLLLSEDSAKSAQALAQQLSIQSAVSDADSSERVKTLYELPKGQRPAAYITTDRTDGSPLGAADVGIALGREQLSVVMQYARVFILDSSLSKVSEALDVANTTFARSRAIITISLALSLGLVIVAALGIINPWYALAGRVVTDAVTMILSLQFKKY